MCRQNTCYILISPAGGRGRKVNHNKGNKVMKATAHQIGNSKKERILLDGEEFLKSVNIGRWNYIVVITEKESGRTHYGKSATRENALKWVPFPMYVEYYNLPTISPNGYNYREEFKKAVARGVPVKRKGGYQIACDPIEYTRTITKIVQDI